jgi:hypothetical protein
MNRFFSLSLSVFAVACAAAEPEPTPVDTDDGRSAESGLCAPVSETPVGPDEPSAAGFSPRAALDAAVGVHAAPIAWADGVDGTVTAEVEATGDAVFVDFEVKDDGSGMEPALGCVDQLEIPVTLSLASDDGRLALVVDARLVAAADGASAWLELPADVDLAPFVPAGSSYDAARGFVSLTWTAAGLSGAIDGQGEGTDGDVAYAETFDVATIGG